MDDYHSNVFTGSFWHSWNPVIVQLDGSNEMPQNLDGNEIPQNLDGADSNEIPQNLDEVDLSSLDFEKLQI